jgi:LppP/LprE lipoprotein
MKQKQTATGPGATNRRRIFLVATGAASVLTLALAFVPTAAEPAFKIADALPLTATTASRTTDPTSRTTSTAPAPARVPTTTKRPESPATATTTTTAVQRPAVATDSPSVSLLRAETSVRNMNYTPVANAWYPDSVPGPLLEAIEAVPAGTVVGNQGHKVFFFVSGKYVGTDTSDGSANLEFAYSTGLVVAVNYDLYHPSDPLCCPSAGARTVRFEWDGNQLHVLDAIPTPDPAADPTRN